MKSKKITILIAILVVLTAIFAMVHLSTREEVPENALKITMGEENYLVDVEKLHYEQVTGIRVNGKGEEIPVDAPGILLKEVLIQENITEFSNVTVIADDSYSAFLTAQEVHADEKVYLLYEEETLRLQVFGDENSKRSVSNVVQIVVETEDASEMKKEAVTFTDDLGREVTVENPKRVAALLGSFADMWYLAGGEVIASADDAWDDFDLPMAEDAVNLGQTKELSLEKLFAAEPDFILASINTRLDMEWQETLEQSGIPTAFFDVSDFSDYLRVLKICTDITGREDLYEKHGLLVQAEIEQMIEKSEARIAEKGAPKVLYLRTSASSILVKNSEGNVLGEMLKTLGCENIADDDETLLENISMEHILQEDPDFIFFVQFGDDEAGTQANIDNFIKENPAWQELTAVKEGRVYNMEKSLYNLKPNDRWAKAYEKLEGILADGQK